MNPDLIVALANNAAVLLALSIVCEIGYLITSKYRYLRSIISGILIALICFVIMKMPFRLIPGVVFDTRSILISVTALTFGPIPTAITVVAAILTRLASGGAGSLPGIAVIVSSALIGLAWRRWLYPKSARWRWFNTYIMSIVVHAVMLACMLLIPYPDNLTVIREIALPVMLIYPVVSILLSLLLLHQQERWSAQEQLKQSEERFQLLFRKMLDGFALHEIICDEQGKPVDYRFLAVNPSFERMTGLKADEIIGKTVLTVLPKIEPFWIEIYGRVALTGEPAEFEYYSGSVNKHFAVNAYQPEPNQFACAFSDITKRVLAESGVRKVLSRLRALLDNNPSPIVIIDDQGRFIEVSAAATRIIGLTREQIIDKPLSQVLTTEIAERLSGVLASLRKNGQPIEQVNTVTFMGNTRIIESTTFVIKVGDGEADLFGISGIDVTDRISAEQALKESEQKYSSYIENAPDGIFVTDEKGCYIEVNQAACELTGYSREELMRMSIKDITTEESQADSLFQFKVLQETGVMSVELPFRHKTGATRWWTVNAVKLSDNRFLGFSSDITDKKKAEEEILYVSYHDRLTGLYNRFYFDAALEQYDAADQLPLSIIIGDINGLKLINDAFGHAEGDRLIAEMARIIQICCRDAGILARTGGDEFSMLLPRTNSDNAYEILKEIQTAFKSYNMKVTSEVFQINISLGYGTKEQMADDFKAVIKVAENHMNHRKLLENKSSHSAIISSIKATMLEKSNETEEHAERLVFLSHKVGVSLKLSTKDLDYLELVATLHDIGKVGIADQILNKPGRLTDDEWIIMKKHPEIGYRIAMSSPELAPIAEYILSHHERWDGKGYPQGLAGSEIPFISRILAVVDAYDAMTQNRPYRQAMTHDAAIAEIQKNAGTQFDPAIARTFLDLI